MPRRARQPSPTRQFRAINQHDCPLQKAVTSRVIVGSPSPSTNCLNSYDFQKNTQAAPIPPRVRQRAKRSLVQPGFIETPRPFDGFRVAFDFGTTFSSIAFSKPG